jgi:hypothetical protein
VQGIAEPLDLDRGSDMKNGAKRHRRSFLLPMVLILPAICLAIPVGGDWEVLPRLAIAFIFIMVFSGFLVIWALDWRDQFFHPFETFVASLVLGYIFLTGVCSFIMLTHLNGTLGLYVILGVETALSFLIVARPPENAWRLDASRKVMAPDRQSAALAALAVLLTVVVAYAGWVIGAPIEGEEILDLGITRKFAELPSITLDGIAPKPATIATYILAPYQFAIALISKLSGLSIVVVYVKLRPFLFVSTLMALWCLSASLLRSHVLAWVTTTLVLLLLLIDPDPWMWPASFFPHVRRGAFAAGILLTAMIYITQRLCAAWTRPTAAMLSIPPLLFLCLLVTHGLEAFFALWFIGGMMLCALLSREGEFNLTRSMIVACSVTAAGAVYRVLQGALVPRISAYEAMWNAPRFADVVNDLLQHPVSSLLGGVPEGGKLVIATFGAISVWAVLPIAFLPVLILRFPQAGRILYCALAPSIVLMSTKAGADLLVVLSATNVFYAMAYFAPLGLVATTLLLYDVVSIIDPLAMDWRPWVKAATGVGVGLVLLGATYGLLMLIVAVPLLLTAFGAVGGAAAWILQLRMAHLAHSNPRGVMSPSMILLLLTISVPLFIGMKFFPGKIDGSDRQNLFAEFFEQRKAASVVDWTNYYPILQRTARPPIDLPLTILHGLARVVPAGSIVIYDPDHSFALPALIPVYTANPGQLLASNMDYFRDYVVREGNSLIHPLYNERPAITKKDACFLANTKLDYIITNPRYATLIAAKLAPLERYIRTIFDNDGYTVYAVSDQFKAAAGALCVSKISRISGMPRLESMFRSGGGF